MPGVNLKGLFQMQPNPVHKPGIRHALCDHYESCLDHAVRHYWLYWDCSQCAFNQREESAIQGPSKGASKSKRVKRGSNSESGLLC